MLSHFCSSIKKIVSHSSGVLAVYMALAPAHQVRPAGSACRCGLQVRPAWSFFFSFNKTIEAVSNTYSRHCQSFTLFFQEETRRIRGHGWQAPSQRSDRYQESWDMKGRLNYISRLIIHLNFIFSVTAVLSWSRYPGWSVGEMVRAGEIPRLEKRRYPSPAPLPRPSSAALPRLWPSVLLASPRPDAWSPSRTSSWRTLGRLSWHHLRTPSWSSWASSSQPECVREALSPRFQSYFNKPWLKYEIGYVVKN